MTISEILDAVALLHKHCNQNICINCSFGQEKGKKCLLNDSPPWKWDKIESEIKTDQKREDSDLPPLDTYEGLFDEDALEAELDDYDIIKMYEVPLNAHEDPFPNCYAGCLDD